MDRYLVKRKFGDSNGNQSDKSPQTKRQKYEFSNLNNFQVEKSETDDNPQTENRKQESHYSTSKKSTVDSKQTKRYIKADWKKVPGENLNVTHAMLFDNSKASELLCRCEQELTFFNGGLAQVQIFGKWIPIPRKHVAHGDPGLTYTFSNNTIPARPWTPLLTEIRQCVSQASGYDFNFVLINRYDGGSDYMGEHKDDEKDLCQGYPIASLSLGQARDFVFKHQDQKRGTRKVPPVTVQLKHGMLLMMEHPTNSFWYHSLPKRAAARGVRINMTFRKMDPSKCKPVTTSSS